MSLRFILIYILLKSSLRLHFRGLNSSFLSNYAFLSSALIWGNKICKTYQTLYEKAFKISVKHSSFSKNGPGRPRHLFHSFLDFSNKQYDFKNKSMWKISCPTSALRRDSNSWPLEHESSPMTTRPQLPPQTFIFCLKNFLLSSKFSVFFFSAF